MESQAWRRERTILSCESQFQVKEKWEVGERHVCFMCQVRSPTHHLMSEGSACPKTTQPTPPQSCPHKNTKSLKWVRDGWPCVALLGSLVQLCCCGWPRMIPVLTLSWTLLAHAHDKILRWPKWNKGSCLLWLFGLLGTGVGLHLCLSDTLAVSGFFSTL